MGLLCNFNQINIWAADYFNPLSTQYDSLELRDKIISELCTWAYNNTCVLGNGDDGYNLGGNVGKCEAGVFICTIMKIFNEKMYIPEKGNQYTSYLFMKLSFAMKDYYKETQEHNYRYGSEIQDNTDDEKDSKSDEGLSENYSEDRSYDSYDNKPLVYLAKFVRESSRSEKTQLIYAVIYSLKIINASRFVFEINAGPGSHYIVEALEYGYTTMMMDLSYKMPSSFSELCRAKFSKVVKENKLSVVDGLEGIEKLADKSIVFYFEPINGITKGTVSKYSSKFDEQFDEILKDLYHA